MEKKEIYDFLMDLEHKARVPDWDNEFKHLTEIANIIALELCKIECLFVCRKSEKEKKIIRKPHRIIEDLINKRLECEYNKLREKSKENSEIDLFFYPCKFINAQGEFYFNNKFALDLLNDLLRGNYKLPVELNEDNISQVIQCALSLKTAFASLLTGKEIPSKIFIFMIGKFYNLMRITNELQLNVMIQELRADQNSRNASTRTPARIEDYKKHEKYPELEQMIKSYQDTPKELREINKLMQEIIDTKNKVTIRRYRHLFFQDI